MTGTRPSFRLRLALVLAALALSTGCAQSGPEASPGAVASAPAKRVEPDVPAGSCGKSGLPDCPLQGWMKGTLQASLKAGDLARLASALDELAHVEPRGYDGWAASARAGASAARGGDVEAVRAECRACHERLRAKFRAEMRGSRLF